MKRTLLCLTAIALLGACKKDPGTTPPDGGGTPPGDTGGGGGGTTAPTTVPQEPDPPAIAEARTQYLLGNYDKAKETLEPLLADLKTRQQLRASGLTAGWLALAVVDPVAENAKEPAEYAVQMGDQTADKEVQIVGKLAIGAYQLGTEDYAKAAENFEGAFKLQQDGPNAALALVMYGQAKINLAFGGEEKDTITNPGEIDAALSTFTKAQRLAAGQAGNELVAARAYEGMASAANYKKALGDACTNINEAVKIYQAKGAGQPLLDRANAIMDAAGGCKK
jgi:tetratricopeptide (TPR) repeat protein